MRDAIGDSYDELPYVGIAFAYMHPNALARVAILAGLDPPPVESCRVLELGCATGRNLIPMAEALPGATFVGIDLSARQVEEGVRTIEAVGLGNVRLMPMSIMDLTPEFGQFDYILCHGVYSWVPPEVQAKIFDVCRENLAPAGLACVSYNVYPGWHRRLMTREMMLYHVDPAAPLAQRARQARELFEALAAAGEHVWKATSSHATAIREDLHSVRTSEDDYVVHEFLAPCNQPLYYHEFVSRARAKRLRCVGGATSDAGAARVQWAIDAMDPPLLAAGGDPVRREQYLDFIVGRTFRATVLGHDTNAPAGRVDAVAAVGRMWIVGLSDAADAPEGEPAGAVAFANTHGTMMTVREPILRTAMTLLAERRPAEIRFDELCRQVAIRLGLPGEALPAAGRALLADSMLRSQAACMVQFFAHLPECADEPSERPTASAFVRFQAARGETTLTNRRHESVKVAEPLDLLVLPLLDGTRDRAALLAGVQDALTARAAANRPLDPPPASEALPALIEESLRRAAGNWLLVG